MAALDRFRRRLSAGSTPAARQGSETQVDEREQARLWAVLKADPNDIEAFHRLADAVRRRAAEGHDHDAARQQRAMDDASWSLAEELAHSGHAWYPLIELARLSVHDDHEKAIRRLATATERDASGAALATALRMLRDAGLPGDALGLGVGHWRPREHDLEAGRQLVTAAVEAGRVAEARRHLAALELHPDQGRVAAVRAELERLIQHSESGAARPPAQTRPPTAERAPEGEARPPEVWSTTEPTRTTGPGTGGLPILDLPEDPPPAPRVVDLREPAEARQEQSGRGGLLDRFRRR
jgi:hypothetical protein